MSKYIDAAFAKAEFTGNFQNSYTPGQIKAILDEVPAADVVEVKHGEWEERNGTVMETPFGMAKVYDHCPIAGTVDVYVSW